MKKGPLKNEWAFFSLFRTKNTIAIPSRPTINLPGARHDPH